MDEVRAVPRKEARGVVTDHAPVADGDEIGALAGAVDGEVLEDARNEPNYDAITKALAAL